MIAYIYWPGLCDGKNAAVAGGTVKSFKLRTLPQFPGQGVFAAAAADKKHIHAYFLARKNGNGTGTLTPGWQSHPEAKLKTKIIVYEIISSETDKLLISGIGIPIDQSMMPFINPPERAVIQM